MRVISLLLFSKVLKNVSSAMDVTLNSRNLQISSKRCINLLEITLRCIHKCISDSARHEMMMVCSNAFLASVKRRKMHRVNTELKS